MRITARRSAAAGRLAPHSQVAADLEMASVRDSETDSVGVSGVDSVLTVDSGSAVDSVLAGVGVASGSVGVGAGAGVGIRGGGDGDTRTTRIGEGMPVMVAATMIPGRTAQT
jgi:hypothetical protein